MFEHLTRSYIAIGKLGFANQSSVLEGWLARFLVENTRVDMVSLENYAV
jgi:hypothetical protein